MYFPFLEVNDCSGEKLVSECNVVSPRSMLGNPEEGFTIKLFAREEPEEIVTVSLGGICAATLDSPLIVGSSFNRRLLGVCLSISIDWS